MTEEHPGPADPLTAVWRSEDVAVLGALRDWTVGQAEMNHHLGRWAGLPTSDANALGHVVWAAEAGEPLSPQALSRRLGMTTGATTVLLDRLERAGMVVRSRESADRRRVTLRPSDEGRERARTFTAFAGRELAAAVQAASAQDLRVVADFLERLSGAVAAGNERLRQREV